MQLNIAPESYAALRANGTLRCLFETNYTPSSRHSSVAIALAHDLVKEFMDALLAHIAQTEAGARPANANPTADLKLNVVTLRRGKSFFICYDMFLKGCEVRDMVDQSVDQPIHVIYKAGNVYYLRRNPALDRRVAQEYADLQQVDKGPRPYFTDSKNPPVYDEGERIEDPEDELYETKSRGKEEEGRGETSRTETQDDEDDDNYDEDNQEDEEDGPSVQLLTEYYTSSTKSEDEDEDEDFIQIPTPDASSSASKRRARGQKKSARDKEITSAVEGAFGKGQPTTHPGLDKGVFG